MNPVFKVKKAFLDRTKVVRFMDKKTRIAFIRHGGLVRTTAQRSMRTRKGASHPGNPPHSHGKRQLRKLLFFSYDERQQKMVIGPVLLTANAGEKLPGLHERGGSKPVFRESKGFISARYAPRPYMKPAHEKTIGKLVLNYA